MTTIAPAARATFGFAPTPPATAWCPNATPTWFDGPTGPLAGWLHLPASAEVRGGVVLCQPLGREAIVAYRATSTLADSLAADGFAALRFDYPGTGDSADSPLGSDGPSQWVEGICAAGQFLRSIGCESVSVVGLRLGATLAAVAADRCGTLASLVIWDAVSGRTFLREQRALQVLEIGPRPTRADGAVEALGFTYPADVAKAVKSLELPLNLNTLRFESPASGRYLLVTRPAEPMPPNTASLLSSPCVAHVDASGQKDLLNRRSFAAVTPKDTIIQIVDHIGAHAPATGAPIRFSARNSAVVGHTASGREIKERFTRIGPNNLVAVVTEATSAGSVQPSLLCSGAAAEPRFGPGRAWVSLARRAAGLGVRVLRVDCASVERVGDQGSDSVLLYPPGARDAVIASAAWLRQDSSGPVGMFGSCSGAWEAVTAAGAVDLDAVWLINQIDWERKPTPTDGVTEGARAEANVRRGTGPATGRARARQLIKTYLPYRLWLLVCQAGYAATPALLLGHAARRGTGIRLLFSPPDAAGFSNRRGLEAVARLWRRGADVRLTSFPAADHALFVEQGREAVLSTILADLADDLATDGHRVALSRGRT